jgi:low temperature requirement protein LtrA
MPAVSGSEAPAAPAREAGAPAEPRRTAPVELLWDLVFVFAVTQVTTLLRSDLTWAGFGRAMLVLALVWWAWSAYVWVTNAQDPDSPLLRFALLTAGGVIFIAGLAVPHAFGSEGVLFAISYAIVRLGHLALYADISRRGNASFAAIAGFGAWTCVALALLVTGSFLDGGWRVALWTAAAAIDYAGPAWLTRERLRGLQRVAVEHFAERYGLFIIICLGESMLAIGVGAQEHELNAEVVVGVALSLLITAELWWAYFTRFATTAEERLRADKDPVLAAADGYSYIHLVIVAGIIVFAVGAREAVADVSADLGDPARLALCGGIALWMLGGAAFRLRMVGTIGWEKLAAAAACLGWFAVSGGVPAWVDAGALAVILAALLLYERGHDPAEAAV